MVKMPGLVVLVYMLVIAKLVIVVSVVKKTGLVVVFNSTKMMG